ncbi:hypothetical protein Tco_1551531 [Tanacetum coccineum]
MYTMVCIRPDIAHAVGVVSRFMSNPGREHWEVVKWLLRYLKGTSKTTLCFSRKEWVVQQLVGCLEFRSVSLYQQHIKIRYHYIRELVSERTLSLKKILGAKNPKDMLTKVVTTEKLKLCAASTSLRDN